MKFNNAANLAERLQKNNQLEKIISKFETIYCLHPRIGVEIEFYLSPDIDVEQLSYLVQMQVKQEKGENQFEVELAPSVDLISYVTMINVLRANIIGVAEKLGGKADFSSKLFAQDYGSSMHFHIDFIEKFDLLHSAKSLCHFMLESFLAFMPKDGDYLRIDQKFMAPTHVSYGYNNRTVAVRIPDSMPKRLEYRIAGADCNPYVCLFAILKAIFLGLENFDIISDLTATYGNAFDPQYNLRAFPKTKQEAIELFNERFFTQ